MRRPPAETPLMRQFLEVKDRYPDGIVFFRLGDFYEMFYEDALVASKALDLTLTTRDKGREDAVPMCGVPHHSARAYIQRLTELGHKVVVCEQVEDPRLAKGIVRRQVTRIVTPGIVLDEDMLDARAPRYLAAVAIAGDRRGLAYLDVTTGELVATETDAAGLAGELGRIEPRELLAEAQALEEGGALASLGLAARRVATSIVTPMTVEQIGAALAGIEQPRAPSPPAAQAVAWVVDYARRTQPGGALPLTRLVLYRPEETVVLDDTARTNLEITETLVERRRQGSLLGVLDETRTSPGGRMLRRWLLFPLTDVARIRRRQDAVEHLVERASLRAELRARLGEIHDLERLAGRVTLGVASPRDLAALRRSLERLPELAVILAEDRARSLATPEMLELVIAAPVSAAAADVAATLVDEPPPQAREGGVVRPGRSREIDELRELAGGAKDQILRIEARERERTGIGSLKVRYNRVFGYYLEITRANARSVPADYIRKQTLANAERYVTPELADLEAKVLTAEERLLALEAAAIEALRGRVATAAPAILRLAERLAALDVCAALAEVAHRSSYVRPIVDESEALEIEDGRHPVVEQMVPAGTFVPNDCRLDPRGPQILVVTGPNMAGKSTFLRQVAQIALLAQVGSFVPARRARVGIVDRIFTRVGASDNLARGESTFMVEMRETAAILAGATRRSLLVLDEIGRGTSTYDGVSIAWAVAEYLHDAVGAKTLFATHYHELCGLAARRPRVANVSVAVREQGGEVIFLRKVLPGAASRSYGIEVARLAGLPRSVVARSRQILAELERPVGASGTGQLPLLASVAPPPPAVLSPVEEALAALDPDRMTPLQALTALAGLRAKISAKTKEPC